MKFNTLLPSFLMATSVAVAASLPAQALTFDFSGTDANGTGSAVMNFDGLGTQNLTVDLWNNSPTDLNDPYNGLNAPAITGFGFDALGEPDPIVKSWSLQAYNNQNELVSIDNLSVGDWDLKTDKTFGNDFFDYIIGAFNKAGNNFEIKGGIYNPELMGSTQLAAAPNFFSKATLSVGFSSNFDLDTTSTYVRMQNVGLNGGGSLKLDGTIRKDVPEPLTILGSAAALGFGSVLKKQADKNKNKAAAKDTMAV